MACCELAIENGTHSYGNHGRAIVLRDFSHSFSAGRVVVVMGPNGCGKSTLLRVLVGELRLDSGAVSFRCSSASHKGTYEYLPQDYRQALFPWKDLVTNVRPWKERHASAAPPDGTVVTVAQALTTLDVDHLRRRFPYELSGGQQQIALLARCIASDAKVVILDEPFSALDVIRRAHIAARLRQTWVNSGRIVVCAMHEPDEAVTLADEVIVFAGPPLTKAGSVLRATYVGGDGRLEIDSFRHGISELLTVVSETGGAHG